VPIKSDPTMHRYACPLFRYGDPNSVCKNDKFHGYTPESKKRKYPPGYTPAPKPQLAAASDARLLQLENQVSDLQTRLTALEGSFISSRPAASGFSGMAYQTQNK